METTSKAPRKKRAVNLPENSVGKQRHDLYKEAIDHIQDACQKGFYLEAITLIESVIADRLESRLSALKHEDYSHKVLGDLITQTKVEETDDTLKNLVINDLNNWRQKRNQSLHEMVKIQEGDTSTWQKRTAILPEISKEGLVLLRKISQHVQSLRDKERTRAKKDSKGVSSTISTT